MHASYILTNVVNSPMEIPSWRDLFKHDWKILIDCFKNSMAIHERCVSSTSMAYL